MLFEFDENWHQNQVPYLTHHLLPIFQDKKDIRALEIGSFEGRSTAWWLDNLPIKDMTCVDTWEGSEEHSHIDMTKVFENFKSNVGDRVKWIKESSHTAIPKLEGEFDFIYVDGSHMAKDVLLDGLLCDRILAKGGIILFDDYEWEEGIIPELNRPKIGINAFYNVNFHLYEMMFKEHQICFRKM